MRDSIEKRNLTRRHAVVFCAVLWALVQLGCSSSGTQQGTASRPPGAVSSAQVTTPTEIRSLEMDSEGSAVNLRLAADRQLVWTNYRDSAGRLVIELPNSVPGTGLADLTPASGLVQSVQIEKLDDADRPLTRLIVETREESEHALTTEGRVLAVRLVPVGYAVDEEPVALAYEPLPEEETLDLTEDEEPQAVAAAAPPVAVGTPEQPHVGPPPRGVSASRLFGVEVIGSDTGTVVRVSGDGELAYSTFRLENPERFVIDLAGVVNTASRPNIPVGSPWVEQIRIGQFKPQPDPVSRVVFDLRQFVPPAIERDSEGLIVRFGAPAATTLAADVASSSSLEPRDKIAESEGGDALPSSAEETGEDAMMAEEPMVAEEEVIVAEVSEQPTVEVEAPPSIPVYQPSGEDLAQSQPGAGQPGSGQPGSGQPGSGQPGSGQPPAPMYQPPVQVSDVAQFEAQQAQVPQAEPEEEVLFPQFEALVVSRKEREYIGEPISMSLKNADLVETLRSFAKFSDVNFVIQPGVSGSVTVELSSVPWDQALEQILKINNLGMDIDGTIVRIAPLAQLRAEAEEQRQLAASRQQSIPLRTVLKSVSYATANDIASLLRNRTGSILSSRGTVQVDRRTNTLIIRELPTNIDTVLAVIENLDTPEPQVTIEARIIEATKQFSRSLGISWGFNAIASQELGNTTGLQFPNNIDATGGVDLLTGGANGLLDISLGNILDSFTLDATIQAAENEGLVNVISAPRVTTLNNESASIQSGLQIPIQTVTNRTVSVQFVNATLQLEVTPHVTAEGTILMDINVAKKEPQLAFAIVGASNAPIATKEARTKVVVRDGGTAVIGGIYEVSSNQNQDRVPGLANIPIFGHLFKNRSRDDNNDELMIFITPRIVQM